MNQKIKILIISFLIPFQALAFTYVSPDAFRSPVIKFFSKVWECKWHVSCYHKLGAFTTLATTDSQVNFPTTYNNNLIKTVEVGTTSVASITTLSGLTTASALASIGTITTGTWTGTAVAVGSGGTGATSFTANRLLLGNGTSALTVTAAGTNGQLLTLTGGVPGWSSPAVDQTIYYSWTGSHNFAGATTTILNLYASSTAANPIQLNGVNYNTPSVQGGLNTVLQNNGSGTLTWGNRPLQIIASTTLASAATSLTLDSIPSNDYLFIMISGTRLSGSGYRLVRFNGDATAGAYDSQEQLQGTNNNANSTECRFGTSAAAGGGGFIYQYSVWNYATTSAKMLIGSGTDFAGRGTVPTLSLNSCAWNGSTSTINSINLSAQTGSFGAGTNITVYGAQ